jgi:hypothetical protein
MELSSHRLEAPSAIGERNSEDHVGDWPKRTCCARRLKPASAESLPGKEAVTETEDEQAHQFDGTA